MQLNELLKQNLATLKPKAIIIVKNNDHYTAQNVVYAPELLNLGAILIGYYPSQVKVDELSQLGDCLSIAHYLHAPLTLKYGRNFAENPKFKKLSAKLQKHLTGEIQDCTMSFSRDFGLHQPSVKFTDLDQFLSQHDVPYIFLYQEQTWYSLRVNGHEQDTPVNLRDQIAKLLSKKA